MGAEAGAGGETAGGEAPFENGFDDLGKCVVDNAVPEGGGGDRAWFRFVDLKGAVGARGITAGGEGPA